MRWSLRVVKYLILIIVILGIIAFVVLDLLSQQRTLTVEWDRYEEPEPGMFFRLYEITSWRSGLEDSLKMEQYIPPPPPAISVHRIADKISVQDTTHTFAVHIDNRWHYYIMTAVDSVGNESWPSDVAPVFLARLKPPWNVRIK